MNPKSSFKLPSQLNLGTILPGQYGQIVLPLKSSSVSFLNLELSKRALSSGFFLLRQGSNDCKNQMSLVLKPGVCIQVIVASYPEEIQKSTSFAGQLYVSEQENVHTIKLVYKVELPRILCKMMLQNIQTKQKMMRIIINKAVTNQGRIVLTNQEDYGLELQPGLLQNSSITDKDTPFLMKVSNSPIQIDPKGQIIIFITLTTNIGFKHEFKGMKKCVLRNVLTLKTNSVLMWCLPVEIVVIFVKAPQIKE